MTAPSVMRRALLYVPGSSSRFLEKSKAFKVDNVTYDLEDSVAPAKKPEARNNIRDFLSGSRPQHINEIAVRINSVDTGHALTDLQSILPSPNLDAIVIPKVNSASDLHFITDVIRHTLPDRHPSTPSSTTPSQPPLRLIALIESARAITDLTAICRASPYLSGLVLGPEDFAHDLSITRTPSLREFLYARSAIVTAARAHDLPSAIDLVTTSFRGEEGIQALRSESEDGKRLGFNGKQCIHPDQVGVVQEVFAPSEEELEWAVRIVVADEKADRAGKGAWTLEGKMIDVPVVRKAKAVVQKAEVAGMDVAGMRENWKDQEPE